MTKCIGTIIKKSTPSPYYTLLLLKCQMTDKIEAYSYQCSY